MGTPEGSRTAEPNQIRSLKKIRNGRSCTASPNQIGSNGPGWRHLKGSRTESDQEASATDEAEAIREKLHTWKEREIKRETREGIEQQP